MFLESPRFPDDISAGVTYGPEFVTLVAANQGGFESRNSLRQRAMCVGECAHAVRDPDQLRVLLNFFRSVRGRAIGFRFKDWSDFELLPADSALQLVEGTVNRYQIQKVYSVAPGFGEVRKLQKPVAGTVALLDGGTPVPSGVAAGNYSVDTATGIITLVASQSRAISSHVVGAQHQVTLATALAPNVVVGQALALSGVTGSAAAVLNGRLHEVVAVAGAVVTLGTSTSGLAATGGTASLYRQAGGLRVACQFDNACRFEVDRMATNVMAFKLYEWGQIPIVEIRL